MFEKYTLHCSKATAEHFAQVFALKLWPWAPYTGESFGINVVKPGEFDVTKPPRAPGICGSHVLPYMTRALEGLVKNYDVTLFDIEKHVGDPNEREGSLIMKGRINSIIRSDTVKMVAFTHLASDIFQR